MVIHTPLKLLVCLAILLTATLGAISAAYSATDFGGLGVQGDALSADPKPATQSYTVKSTGKKSYSSGPIYQSANQYSSKPVTVSVLPEKPAMNACPPQGPCFPPEQPGLFGQSSIPFDTCCGPIILPRVGCKQFQGSAKIWYATMNSNKIIWGTDFIGNPGTSLDLVSDLGLTKRQYIGEYEGRCQIRPNWGLRFAFMPLAYRDNYTPTRSFFFGYAFYPAFFSTLTSWNRYIYRADIVYDWYQQCHAKSSIFAGYTMYDEKLTISNNLQSRSRSYTFGLAHAGMSIEKAVKNLGPATASMNCQWSVQFLEGYFGWDGYAAGRISVPYGFGRYGYLEAGWRWIVLQRDYPSNTDNHNMEGFMGTVGLIF